jgi:hypothetical protein
VSTRVSDESRQSTSKEPSQAPRHDLKLLAPLFVELSEEEAERAESALAELLAEAAKRTRG